MIKKIFLAIPSIIIGAIFSFTVKGVVVESDIYHIGDAELCFYPNGFIGENGEAHLYRIERNNDGSFGRYHSAVASFYGPDIFQSPVKPLGRNMIVPKFIFADGDYLPVNAIQGAFEASTAHEVYLQDNIVRIDANTFLNAKNIETLTVPGGIDFLGINALAGMDALKTMYFRSPLPPRCEISTSQLSEIWEKQAPHRENFPTDTILLSEIKSMWRANNFVIILK